MKIIKIQKLSNNKYKIVLDKEEITTFDNVILNNNLLYKKEITKTELEKFKKETFYYDAYNKTLKYCISKIRCKMEVLNFLNKFNITSNDKNTIIKKLENLNFINDKKYTSAFISDKIHLSKWGVNKIEKQLREKKISDEIIKEKLLNIDDTLLNFNLENKIRKRINSNHKYSNYELRNKIINECINEGYDKKTILSYIDKYIRDDSNILSKEFDKLYMKYKNKYENSIFIFKLKQKLISKGFDSDSVSELIEKKQRNN